MDTREDPGQYYPGGTVVPSKPAPAAHPVESVNGRGGAVVLTATDVGALPEDTEIPGEETVSGWGFAKTSDVDRQYAKKTDIAKVERQAGEAKTAAANAERIAREANENVDRMSITVVEVKTTSDQAFAEALAAQAGVVEAKDNAASALEKCDELERTKAEASEVVDLGGRIQEVETNVEGLQGTVDELAQLADGANIRSQNAMVRANAAFDGLDTKLDKTAGGTVTGKVTFSGSQAPEFGKGFYVSSGDFTVKGGGIKQFGSAGKLLVPTLSNNATIATTGDLSPISTKANNAYDKAREALDEADAKVGKNGDTMTGPLKLKTTWLHLFYGGSEVSSDEEYYLKLHYDGTITHANPDTGDGEIHVNTLPERSGTFAITDELGYSSNDDAWGDPFGYGVNYITLKNRCFTSARLTNAMVQEEGAIFIVCDFSFPSDSTFDAVMVLEVSSDVSGSVPYSITDNGAAEFGLDWTPGSVRTIEGGKKYLFSITTYKRGSYAVVSLQELSE